jgi:hypothetical protein
MSSTLDILPVEILAIIFTDSYNVWCAAASNFRAAHNEYVQTAAKRAFLLTTECTIGTVSYIVVDSDEPDKLYSLLLHSVDDLPAVTCVNGAKYWYRFNKKHRDNDLPAVVLFNKSKWYQNDKKHRDNGPAVEYTNLSVIKWYQNGLLHRDNDLPAYCNHMLNKSKWYQNGLLHRDNDLPAIIFSDKLKKWYQYGKKHRDNGPAVIKGDNRTIKWYQRGKLHRIDGPAVYGYYGHINNKIQYEEYYVNNKLHRLDGPACANSYVKELYFDGIFISVKVDK